MKGDFVGIGVSFYMYKDSVAIIQPIANGPSAKAGIKLVIEFCMLIRQSFGRKLPSDSLFSNSRAKKGSMVKLVLYRKSENKINNQYKT
jgi:carboxyl-terminal processing protease